MRKALALLAIIFSSTLGATALASVGHTADQPASGRSGDVFTKLAGNPDLEQAIAAVSMNATYIGFGIVLLCVVVMWLVKKPGNGLKLVLFWTIVMAVTSTSFILVGSTIYLNTTASSGGPVHWHADFRFFACGEELSLKDPTGKLSNKVGTPTLHEHNDSRIHLEGVVVEQHDASLGKFMKVVGGMITDNALSIPTNNGDRAYLNGQTCNGQPGEVQLFVYRTNEDKTYSQHKVEHPADYVISPQSQVPAGDCLIIEFDAPKDRTDQLCDQYRFAQQRGDLKGER